MTSVDITRENGITVLAVAGHANYSNDHNDVVCAAISTITQMLMQTVAFYAEQNAARVITEDVDEPSGTVIFSYQMADERVNDALLNAVIIGYKMIEITYPENIKVNV